MATPRPQRANRTAAGGVVQGMTHLNATSPFRRRAPLALATVAALVLAGCGGDDDDTAPAPQATDAPVAATAPAGTTPAPTAPTTEPPAAAGSVVALGDTSLGEVLTDQNGLTLYGFTPDTDGVPTCYDDCAAAWPPVVVDVGTELSVGDGLDASMFSTVARDDTDQVQVVFGDWPLYTFAGDKAAGDVNGQGLNDVWFVVAGDGQLIMPAAETPATNSGGYDY